jgi:hypothetical protein
LKLRSTDGAQVWCKKLGNNEKIQLFEAECDDKQNIWLSGLHLKSTFSDSNYYFLMKVDKNVVPIEMKLNRFMYSSFFFNTYEMYKADNLTFQPSTGNLLVVQDYVGEFAHTAVPGFYGTRHQINVLEPNENNTNIDYGSSSILEIVCAGKNVLYSISDDYIPSEKKPHGYGIWNESILKFESTQSSTAIMKPIRSNDGSFVFYSHRNRTLTKFDLFLNPIWVKKYDNCLGSNKFVADVAADGAIYTVRNTDGKTVVSRLLPNGNLP